MNRKVAPGLKLSVCLPTRNRHAHALACSQSILANQGFLELIVVDQSDGTETKDALSAIADPRLRYVATSTRGVTAARNLGIDMAGGDLVAFTDDDCRVELNWVETMKAVFEQDPEVAVVCGRVHVPEELRAAGFAESFEPEVREWQHRFPPFGRDWGITANLALRRDIVARVGKFDPMLGAGAPLRSGGEPDLLFRVLAAGLKIVNARECSVEHLGIRKYGAEAQRLMRGYGRGTGAALFKHVRLGDRQAMGVYAGFLSANLRRVCGNLVRGRRPTGLGYLVAFVGGSVDSCRYRVDKQERLYAAR
jgi:glycosyltransferase involved in cell wall biosynthesis